MMNQKTIALFMIVVMAVLVGLVLPNNASIETQSHRLLPGLDGRYADVTKVSVESLADGKRVTLSRTNDIWVVVEKGGYPADFEAVLRLLSQLAELNIAETKTARSDNHGVLKLTEAGENAGTLLVLGPGDIALLIGKTGSVQGSFVRHLDDDQVYLTDETVEVSVEILSWVDPVAIDIDIEDVDEVSFATRQAKYLRAGRDQESGDLVVFDLPVGRELKYESIVDTLGRALVNLRFLDVMEFDAELFKDPSMLRVTTTSGEIISVSSVSKAGQFFAHIDTELGLRWQYEISEYNYNELNKTMEDLLKPMEEVDG